MEVQGGVSHRLNFEDDEQEEVGDQNDAQSDSTTIVPKIGMCFDSEADAYLFYKNYGEVVGFGIRRDWLNKNKDDIVTSRKFVCAKEGFRKPKKTNPEVRFPRKERRSGCLAHMTISLQTNNKYFVTSFNEEHNHKLVSPTNVHMIRSFRKVNEVQGIDASLASCSGIKQKEIYEFMSRQVGGRENLGFLRTDLKNYLFAKRKKNMELGEAGSLYYYFQNKQLENSDFHYAIQVDSDNQIANIFWTDAKMRFDYEKYGDVVCFDTTFKTNKEFRPFAPFVGVNNHKETVIFGAALMYDETIPSFTWVFKSFLQAMHNKEPKTILTDQDSAMAHAIRDIFPNSYHRLCVWHLHQNALKHLSHVFRQSKSFAKDFKKCIYDYEEEEEFLQAWEELLINYDLKENSWLEGIFKERKKWALVYGRQTFCADMKSTQLSESFNSTLKRYLNCKLDVLEFFHHFERVLDDVRYKELTSNNEMDHTIPRLKVDAILLRQARDAFTPKVFEWFQVEFEKVVNLVVGHVKEDGSRTIYKIGMYGKNREHVVTFDNLDDNASCSCMKFEFVGILCSHVLKVLDRRDIKVLPTKYIMRRWTKEPSTKCTSSSERNLDSVDPKIEKLAWYKDLCRESVSISGMAVETREDYEYFRDILQEAKAKLKSRSKCVIIPSETHGELRIEEDIDVTQIKGLKKKQGGIRGGSRLKSGLELNKKRRKKQSSTVQNSIPSSSNQTEDTQLLNHASMNVMIPNYYQVPSTMFGLTYPASYQSQLQAHSQEHTQFTSHSQLLQVINNGISVDAASECRPRHFY